MRRACGGGGFAASSAECVMEAGVGAGGPGRGRRREGRTPYQLVGAVHHHHDRLNMPNHPPLLRPAIYASRPGNRPYVSTGPTSKVTHKIRQATVMQAK